MKNWLTGLLMSVVQATVSYGEPVLFKDAVLTINNGIVIVDGETRYYEDIRMTAAQNGSFHIVNATERSLTYVDEISVAVIETNPVQVELQVLGHTPNPCVELETAVIRSGNTFYVVVADTPLQTLIACAQIIQPYEVTIPLDVSGLPPGDYLVVVNGDDIEFTLD